jgi:hypothetical protein
VFQSRYKASMIQDDAYFEHISRYIHLNPKDYKIYPYSSYKYFVKGTSPEWVNPNRILDSFPNKGAYADFVADYEAYKQSLEGIKSELADF